MVIVVPNEFDLEIEEEAEVRCCLSKEYIAYWGGEIVVSKVPELFSVCSLNPSS